MKRNIFAGVLVGAAVLLASCTSTGTATGSSVAPSTASGDTGVVAGSGTGLPASSAPASSEPQSSAPESSAPESSAPESSAPESSAPESSAPESSAPQSSAPGTSAALDGATTAWFTAFCGGLTPLLGAEKDVKTKEAAVAKTDYAAQQKLLVGFLADAGPRLTTVGTTLKSLPAPTFKGGAAFASKVVEAFGQAGPALTATGQKLAAVDVSKGPSGLSAAAPNLAAELAGIAAPITAVGNLDIPDSTKAALLALPACAKLQSTVTG